MSVEIVFHGNMFYRPGIADDDGNAGGKEGKYKKEFFRRPEDSIELCLLLSFCYK